MLGIAPQSLSRKLQEHHKLTLDELNQIALHLGKDASDFLLFKSTQPDEANHPKEVIIDAMNVAQNIRQFVKKFKESISSLFAQLLENRGEAERVEIIKELENLPQKYGVETPITDVPATGEIEPPTTDVKAKVELDENGVPVSVIEIANRYGLEIINRPDGVSLVNDPAYSERCIYLFISPKDRTAYFGYSEGDGTYGTTKGKLIAPAMKRLETEKKFNSVRPKIATTAETLPSLLEDLLTGWGYKSKS